VTTYADPWVALGDPSRRAIFARLAERPRAVTDLAADLPISRPAVSQHLKVLKDAALVRVHPEGTRRIYAVDADGLSALRAELESFWGAALANFKDLVENSPTHSKEQL
jgi:DNA-binding transcriptional ArsR family regulator